MKIYFLGTCAGTEPISGMCHQSMAIESGGVVYFFDAGENCSRTAYLSGVNLLNVRAVFISHTHMDHVGGLGNLLWNIRKIHNNEGNIPICDKTVFISNKSTYDGIMQVLSNTESGYQIEFNLDCTEYEKGKVFSDENITVHAYSNTHLLYEKNRSYSFLIECEGKRIVYSGDLGSLNDLDAALKDGCDILICETGHHKVSTVCEYARGKNVDSLYFTHNGREIINYPKESLCAAKNIFGESVFIAHDAMVAEF